MNPLIIPPDLPPVDLKDRLGRVKSYRSWALRNNLHNHVLTEPELKTWLERSGYDPKLTRLVFA